MAPQSPRPTFWRLLAPAGRGCGADLATSQMRQAAGCSAAACLVLRMLSGDYAPALVLALNLPSCISGWGHRTDQGQGFRSALSVLSVLFGETNCCRSSSQKKKIDS